MKRGMSIVLILAMLVTVMPQMYLPAQASETSDIEAAVWQMDGYDGFVSDGNEITKYYVSSEDGGFYIIPGTAALDAGKSASYGLFEIEGETYRFGKNYKGCDTEFSAPYLNEEGTTQATWRIFDYEITQMLTLKQADQADDSYGVAVVYEILNRGEEESSLRTQIVMDTSFGYLDDKPVVLDNRQGYITNECAFSGDDVPGSYQVDASSGEAPYTYGVLAGGSVSAPDSVIFGHFANLSGGGYGYEPNGSLDFTTPNNDFGNSDSAVVLTYDVQEIAADADAVISTIYGFAGVYQPEIEETETETVIETETEAAPETMTETEETKESETKAKKETVSKSMSIPPLVAAQQGEPADGVDIQAFLEEYAQENKVILFGAGDQISKISGQWTESTGTRESATQGGYLNVEHNYNSNIPWTLVGNNNTGGLVLTTARLDFAHTYHDFSSSDVTMAGLNARNSGVYSFFTDEDTGFLKDFSRAEKDALANVSLQGYNGYRRLTSGSNLFAQDFFVTQKNYKVYLPQATIFPIRQAYIPPNDYTFGYEYNGDGKEVDRHIRYITESGSTETLSNTYERNQRPFGKEEGRDFGGLNPANVTYTLSDVYADNNYPRTTDMEDTELMERSMVSYKNNPVGTDVISTFHPNTVNFITPIVNLQHQNILMISEVVESGGDGIKTINRSDVHGDYTNFDETAVLTVMGSNVNEIGSFTISDLEGSEQDILKTGLQIDNVEVALPEGADESKYRLVYKAVRQNVQGKREIAAWGSSDNLTKITIPCTNLEKGVEYDVYVWLETTKDHYATRIAVKPIHFTGLCKSDDYAVEAVVETGCKKGSKNFRITNGEDQEFITFPAGATVYLKGLGVDDVNRTDLHIKVTERDSKLNIPVEYDSENNYYFFTMPEASLKIAVSAVDKGARFVTAKVTGPAEDEVKEITLSNDKVYTTDSVQIYTSLNSSDYYLSHIEVYENIVDPITLNETERPLMMFEGGTSSRKDYSFTAHSGSIGIKVPDSEGDIIVKVVTQEKPIPKVIFDVSDLKNTEISFGYRNVVREGDTYVCNEFKLGKYTPYIIYSETDYMAFEVSEVVKSDPRMPDVSYHGSYYRNEGEPKFQYHASLVIQPFDRDNWVDGTYTVILKEKPMYRPFQVTSVMPDASVIEKVKKIILEGELLGQLLGKDGVDLLSKPGDIEATKKVILKSVGNTEQMELDLSKAKLSSDSKKLEIPVDTKLMEKLLAWKSEQQSSTSYNLFFRWGTSKGFSLYNEDKYRPEPYGVLGITQDTKGAHSIIIADTESELNQSAGNKEVILTLKGAVSYDQKNDRYILNDEKTLLNGALTYQTAKDTDALYVKEENGAIKVSAESGTLAAPGMVLCNANTAKGFSMDIKNGVTYKTDGYVEETAKKKNLQINWKQDSKLNKLAVQAGMYAYIDGVFVLKGGLSYSGKLNLKIPTMDDPFLEAEMQELRMKLEKDKWKAAGAIASGTAKIGKDSIPGISFDASASANVDTFKRVYEFETSLDFNIFEFEGKLKLAPIKSGALIPDTIDLFLATEAGLTLLPPEIIVLKGVGGGFSGLADTIDKNFQTLPPIMANIKGRIAFFKILTLDSQINAGPTEVSISGKPKLGISEDLSIEIFDTMQAGIYMSEESFSFKAEVSASVVKKAQFLKGKGSLNAGYNFRNKKMTFSGRLYVKLQIPGFKIGIIKIGPITLKEIDMGVSDKEIYGKFKILWFKLGARYQWGKKKLSVSRRSLGTSTDANEHLVEICDESGEVVGVAEIGANIRTISSSEDQTGKQARTARAISEYVLEDIQENSLITLKAPKGGTSLTEVLEVSYSSNGTDYTAYPLFYPRAEISDEENPYLEEELDDAEANALYTADIDENNNEIETIAVTPDASLGNYWKISLKDGRALSYEHVCIDPLEELTHFTNNDQEVTFTAENLKPDMAYSVAIYMTQDYEDDSLEAASILLKTVDIPAGNTSVTDTVDLDIADMVSNLPSGGYQIYGVLQGEMPPIEGAVDAMTGRSASENSTVSMSFASDPLAKVNYFNQNKPECVNVVKAESAGSETARISFEDWMNDPQETMYEVRAYENGEAVQKDGTPLVYQLSADTAKTADNGSYAAMLSGLDPEKTYTFGVTAYKEQTVDTSEMFPNGKMTLTSDEAESNEVLIPRAEYPVITVSADDAVLSEGAEGTLTITSKGNYTAKLSADQPCIFEVSVDGQDTPVYVSNDYETSANVQMQQNEAESYSQVTVKAKNINNDGSNTCYIAVIDNTAPALFVEHKEGIINADAKGNFLINGGTESGATVAMSGEGYEAVSADAEGRFTLQGKISAKSDEIMVSSRDSAGNVSNEMVQIVRSEEEIIAHTVTASAGEGGTISPEGSIMVADGASATFTISPQSGYEVADVQIDGVSAGAVEYYTFSNVKEDHTINVTFKKLPEEGPKDPGGEDNGGDNGEDDTNGETEDDTGNGTKDDTDDGTKKDNSNKNNNTNNNKKTPGVIIGRKTPTIQTITKAVKSGDYTNIIGWGIVLVLSIGIVLGLSRRKKQHRD